ncbi:hypothetical protein [Labrenzia sp. DG1229]|uniref:hypothetical protein n=1 Tax=Labrenzia sp. DG1229 TaxID=681847 RepID=UPI00048A5372|nr:hypothetical protein [Labrenzia sp. DG1229]
MSIRVLLAVLALLGAATSSSFAQEVTLHYSDGRPETVGIEQINKVLRPIGVRASSVAIPEAAAPILKASLERGLTPEESTQLLSIFALTREQLLEQIDLAGRTPETRRGGYLATHEPDVDPYPKVYDNAQMTPDILTWVLGHFGKFHVNSSDDGHGNDEVMTVLSAGPWHWFWQLHDGTVVKLKIDIEDGGPGLRLSYPGLGPHAAWGNLENGIVVAYVHGPETFVVRYEETAVGGAGYSDILGTNPWIDFSGDKPVLLDSIQ